MKLITVKLITAALAVVLLLGCKKNLELRSPSNGEVFTIVKVKGVSDSFENSDEKSYNNFEDILADLTEENYLGRMTYNDLPVTWWDGVVDINYQSWSVTTDKKRFQITVYQRKFAPGRIINVYNDGDPSDYYAVP